MATIDNLLKKLPPETQQVLRTVWQGVPAGERGDLLALLRYLPNESNLMRLLLQLANNQIQQAFGSKHRVAIVGPANVGKSTLYNQFVQQKEDRAAVSPVPGTTRENQAVDAGLFELVDTPGADAVGEVGERERQIALDAATRSDFLVIVFDAIQGIKQTELGLYRELVALNKPFLVTLNKIDLVRKERSQVLAAAAQALGLEVEQIVPVSARTGDNLAAIVQGIAVGEPGLVTALGRALPQYRWQLAWRTIAGSSSVAAAIALTPLPIVDFAPLLVTQSVMVLGIARIYDYRITLERARELIVTFGLGFLGRRLFAELTKLGGVPGWVLSAAIAASMTVVMGLAAAVWFERGERLSHDTLNRLTRELTGFMLDALKGLGKRRPDKASLRERVEQALQQSDLAKDPGALGPLGGTPDESKPRIS